MQYVTIKKFSEMSGYTPDAIKSKIKRGDWIQGHVWRKAPDGRTLIDTGGYDNWVLGKESGRSLHHLTKLASSSKASVVERR